MHFVGFRDERYLTAVRVFGLPDFIHRGWDLQMSPQIYPNHHGGGYTSMSDIQMPQGKINDDTRVIIKDGWEVPWGVVRMLEWRDAEIQRLRVALEEIAEKGVTTGYGKAALATLARAALHPPIQKEGK